jgi:hypothetical protein
LGSFGLVFAIIFNLEQDTIMLSNELLHDLALMIKSIDYKLIAKKHKASQRQMQFAIAFCLGTFYARNETFMNRYQKELDFYKSILELNLQTITRKDKRKLIQDFPESNFNIVNLRAFDYFKQGYKYEIARNKRAG